MAASTHSFVEGLRLVSQVFWLCHEVVQLLSSFQKAFHGVVLQKKTKKKNTFAEMLSVSDFNY